MSHSTLPKHPEVTRTELPPRLLRSIQRGLALGDGLSPDLLETVGDVWDLGSRLFVHAKAPYHVNAQDAERLTGELTVVLAHLRPLSRAALQSDVADPVIATEVQAAISRLERLRAGVLVTSTRSGRPRGLPLDIAQGLAATLMGLGIPRSTACRFASACAREAGHAISFAEVEQRIRRGPHTAAPTTAATLTVKSRLFASDGLRTRIELETSKTTTVTVSASERPRSWDLAGSIERRLDEIRRAESSLKAKGDTSTFELSLCVEARIETERLLGALGDERVSTDRLRKLVERHSERVSQFAMEEIQSLYEEFAKDPENFDLGSAGTAAFERAGRRALAESEMQVDAKSAGRKD